MSLNEWINKNMWINEYTILKNKLMDKLNNE